MNLLPLEVKYKICLHVPVAYLKNIALFSRQWYEIYKDEYFWTLYLEHNFFTSASVLSSKKSIILIYGLLFDLAHGYITFRFPAHLMTLLERHPDKIGDICFILSNLIQIAQTVDSLLSYETTSHWRVHLISFYDLLLATNRLDKYLAKDYTDIIDILDRYKDELSVNDHTSSLSHCIESLLSPTIYLSSTGEKHIFNYDADIIKTQLCFDD